MSIPPYPGAPVIFMCHEPDYADSVIRHPRFPLIDLMLCGHTHGGQVRLPLVGPLILPPMGKKYIRGLFHFDHMQLYVNRGLGTVDYPSASTAPPRSPRSNSPAPSYGAPSLPMLLKFFIRLGLAPY